MSKSLTQMTAEIVTAQASHMAMSPEDLRKVLNKVFNSLKKIHDMEAHTAEGASKKAGRPEPLRGSSSEAFSDPASSIREDRVICLECHKQFRHLTHTHLRNHGLTPATYRKKYGISDKQPLMADAVRKQKHLKAVEMAAKGERSHQKAEAV